MYQFPDYDKEIKKLLAKIDEDLEDPIKQINLALNWVRNKYGTPQEIWKVYKGNDETKDKETY